MRTKLLKASVVFALLTILLGMPLLLTPHRIRRSTLALIKAGMTEAEVEELLGVKAGNYDGYYPGFANIAHGFTPDPRLPRPWKTWTSRHGCVEVWFDNQQRVSWHRVYGAAPGSWWVRLWEEFFPRPKDALLHFQF